MIAELSAQNFKSWEDTGKLQFAPLTGFFGANNSGKTSILQVLLMLKQTAEQPPEWNEPLYFGEGGSPVSLIDFGTVIHRHKQDLSLDISVSWKLSRPVKIHFGLTNSLSFSTSVAQKNESVELDYFSYAFGKNRFRIGWTDQGYMVIPANSSARPMSADPFRCYGILNPTGLRNLTGPQEPSLDLQKTFEDLFSRVHYLGPRRDDPRHGYSWRESHPKDIGRHGEKMISALLSSRVQLRSTDEQIAKRLQKLGLIDSYTLKSTSNVDQDYELLVKQYKDGPEVGLTNVGFGVSQVLPVLTLCYYADEGSTLILEQPEAHLHPKAQSELADVLIDVVKNRNIQIILESHSEHLLLRLMRRIAEEEISADQTAFHFCEIKDGNSRAEQLKVDEYGNISNWPQNFFGDDMGDLAEKTKAEMKRRKANK